MSKSQEVKKYEADQRQARYDKLSSGQKLSYRKRLLRGVQQKKQRNKLLRDVN